METSYDLVLHDNYGLSSAEASSQRSTKTPEINSVAGVVSLALQLGVPILNQSGNSRLERTNLAAGVSSKTSVFKLQSYLTGLNDTNSTYGGKLVVSKHVPKGHAESESQRYDALARDMVFLSHDPVAQHNRFVNIIALGWEDAEDVVENRIWPVLLFEFAEYGTLEDFFDLDDTDKSWDTKQAICRDVAVGLEWLHACHIIHSDVKFGNVLMFRDADSTFYSAKLSDFGFALDVDALEASGREAARLDGFTPPCAPEADTLIPLNLLTKFDVFSFGLLFGRVFLNGDVTFTRALQSCSPAELAYYEFERNAVKLGYDDEQLQLVSNLIASTTSADPESRIEMKDALKMISASEKTNAQLTPSPIEYEDEGTASLVPDIEKVWTLDLSATACKTVFADLVRIMDDYNSKSDVSSAKSEAYDELKEAAAKAAYQLHLAHLIGMGCDVSNETAIDQLLLSARLGHEDAQKEAFGTIAALKHEMSRPERDDVIQWLTQAAINGDMACLQELRALDQGAYQAVATSEAHRKAMCERSGFIFDDDFVECNDVGDVPGLIAAIMDSGEPIDSDIGGGLTWLHYAIFSGSLELATKLVDEFKLPLDARNSKGQTPLWIACLSGNFEMSAFLFSRGADASIASNSGNNPLHHLVAFEEEYIESMAQNLQAQGADVNGRNAVGMTPLHYAIRGSGNLEEEAAVAALLQLGADPLIRDDEDETPLAAAIYTMRPFYLKRLLEYAPLSTMPGAELHNILASAFRGWIWSMKHHRLRSGSLLYTDRIAHLVRFFHTDEVHDAFTASDPAGFTPLHAACASCADDIASEIIKLPNARLGLDAGEYGYTPIMIAIRKSTWPLIEKLIDAGADLLATARTGENVIHHVVQYRPGLLPYVCDQIEKRRADLASMCNQATAWKGETPLDYALSLGRPEAAHFLIGKGADPNALRESKENAGLWLNSLRFCLVPPSVRMLELLLPYLEPGSFVCAGNGMNLLHLACIHVPDELKPGDSTLAQFINTVLDHFPPCLESRFGSSSITPLHLAAAYGNVAAVKILLHRGASPFVKDGIGRTPIEGIEDDDGEVVDLHGHVVVGIVRQRSLRRWRDTRGVLRRAMEPSHKNPQ